MRRGVVNILVVALLAGTCQATHTKPRPTSKFSSQLYKYVGKLPPLPKVVKNKPLTTVPLQTTSYSTTSTAGPRAPPKKPVSTSQAPGISPKSTTSAPVTNVANNFVQTVSATLKNMATKLNYLNVQNQSVNTRMLNFERKMVDNDQVARFATKKLVEVDKTQKLLGESLNNLKNLLGSMLEVVSGK